MDPTPLIRKQCATTGERCLGCLLAWTQIFTTRFQLDNDSDVDWNQIVWSNTVHVLIDRNEVDKVKEKKMVFYMHDVMLLMDSASYYLITTLICHIVNAWQETYCNYPRMENGFDGRRLAHCEGGKILDADTKRLTFYLMFHSSLSCFPSPKLVHLYILLPSIYIYIDSPPCLPLLIIFQFIAVQIERSIHGMLWWEWHYLTPWR